MQTIKYIIIILISVAVGSLATVGMIKQERSPISQQFEQDMVLKGEATQESTVDKQDSYEGWYFLNVAGVIEVRIPPGCSVDGTAGGRHVACPVDGQYIPAERMRFNSDGMTVHISRGNDGLGWEYYDAVLASIRVLAPFTSDVHIDIDW